MTVQLKPTGRPDGTVMVFNDDAFIVMIFPLSDAFRLYESVCVFSALEVIRYPPSDTTAEANVAPEVTYRVVAVIPAEKDAIELNVAPPETYRCAAVIPPTWVLLGVIVTDEPRMDVSVLPVYPSINEFVGVVEG